MFTYSKEKELHEFIVDNFNRYFDFEYNSSEYVINGGRVDILGKDDNSIYVIEIKRDIVTDSTLKQLSSYIPTIQEQHPDKEVFGIAVAPAIDKRINLNSLPPNVNIKIIDDVTFLEPERNHTKKRVTFTLDEKTIDDLKSVSEQTMIPQARLVEEAIKQIVEKHKPSK